MINEGSVTIAVSTMYRMDLTFLESIVPKHLLYKIPILVINQTDDARLLQTGHKNITVINTTERGLAKSRNMAINNITTTYAVLTDDDVIFRANLMDMLQKGFALFPKAGVIKFRAAKVGDAHFGNYRENAIKNLSILGIMNVSSIELAVNVEKLKQSNAFFDEYFGLGAAFGNGLEQAFLDNVRKKKLQIAYYPEIIVNHPDDCSGRNAKTERHYYINGALGRKMFGKMFTLWAGIFVVFQIKHKNIASRKIRYYYNIFKKGSDDYSELIKNEKH